MVVQMSESIVDIINECSKASNEKECKYQHIFRDGSRACGYIPTTINQNLVCMCQYQGILNYFNNYGKRQRFYDCLKK
jgi:hypothetical protein